ncbi:MAG: hypothetical protein KTR24_04870 [Saprospiraceae bacterium]|nr:hypothetical protein [Saprospiraceae bacterium]
MRYGFIMMVIATALAVEMDAQAPIVQTRNIGLPQNLTDRTVTSIIQDKAGYLWIGTRNGLNRYNGIKVLPYDNRLRTDFQISGKDIRALVSRQDGSIVIQYERNRSFLDILSGESTKAERLFLNDDNGVIAGKVEDILLAEQDGTIHLLISQDDYLFIQELTLENVFAAPIAVEARATRASSTFLLKKLRGERFMINDSNFGFLTCNAEGAVVNVQTYDTLHIASGNLASVLHQDRQGRIWLAVSGFPGLFEYNEAAELFTPFLGVDENSMFTDAWEDKHGNMVICEEIASARRFYFIGNDDQVKSYSDFTGDPSDINTLYSTDFERINYAGTDNGMDINLLRKDVVDVLVYVDSTRSSPDFNVTGVGATAAGPVLVVDQDARWYYLPTDEDVLIRIPQNQDTLAESTWSSTTALEQGGKNYFWTARISDEGESELVGLSVADLRFETYSFPLPIIDLATTAEGNIWLVAGNNKSDSRLSIFDRQLGNFFHFYLEDGENPLANTMPTSILLDQEDRIWVGTTEGIRVVDLSTDKMEVHRYRPADYYGLSSDHVLCLKQQKDGKVLVGTAGGGLNIFDPVREDFQFFDVRDGLASNHVMTLEQDTFGNTWMCTAEGISIFIDELNLFRNFGSSDGFINASFNQGSAALDSNGVLYFGTGAGLNVFRPADILDADSHAPVLLSELSYYDREQEKVVHLTHNLQNIGVIELPARNRFLQCEFSLADYTYPELHRYRYQLEGADDDWHYLGQQNEVRFDDLGPGSYTLVVQGIDRNGNVSSQALQLPIKVDTFFYRKWWFVLICLGLLSLVAYLVHMIRVQQVIRLERLRTKISSDLHDDVGGLLSGLAMQTELLEYSAKEKDKPKLKRISDLSRSAMAQMRDVIWATDARKDHFEDLLERMKEYAAEILFSRGIEFYFHVENINTEKKIPVHIRQNLYLIVKESLTNIAKHSTAKRVDIFLTKNGNTFGLSVQNDGAQPTLNGESVRQGSGLSNMRMRAESIGAEIKIDRENSYQVDLSMRTFV